MTSNDDLTPREQRVLDAFQPGRNHALDLAERAGISAGSIYPALAKLERLGYAESGLGEAPRRRWYQTTGR